MQGKPNDAAFSPKATTPKATVVFITGLFGAGLNHRALERIKSDPRLRDCRIISLTPGPVSSARDRAIECFYMLKGGRVDYGQEHSAAEGHERFGRWEEGLMPEWDEKHPIDLVGYSLGSTTARYLQHLLVKQEFSSSVAADGKAKYHKTKGTWVRSIITMQGVNNGTNAIHLLGMDPETLDIRPWTILWVIYQLIYFSQWLSIPVLDDFWRLETWGRCRRQGCPLVSLLHDPPAKTDNAGRDLCPKRMVEINEEIATSISQRRHTYYYAFHCHTTYKVEPLGTFHVPRIRRLFYKFPLGFIIGTLAALISFTATLSKNPLFRFLFPRYSFKTSGAVDKSTAAERTSRLEEWHQASDGLVSVAGQRHPEHETGFNFQGAIESLVGAGKPLSGVWHSVHISDEWDHFDSVFSMHHTHEIVANIVWFISTFPDATPTSEARTTL